MADVAGVGESSILNEISASNKFKQEVGANTELGQEEFLSLMTTQLQNQDPLAPMENGDFIAQLAQFGTVSGIGDLQASVDSLSAAMTASDATDAASLVGKSVLTESSVGRLAEDVAMTGAVEVPENVSNMQVQIESMGGVLVDSFEIANQSAGMASFKWDGKLADGTQSPPGSYVLKATGAGSQGPETLKTFVGSRVDSVTMSSEGKSFVLNLSGIGAKPLSEVSQLGL